MNTLSYFIPESAGLYKMKQSAGFAIVVVGALLLFAFGAMAAGLTWAAVVMILFAVLGIMGFVNRKVLIDMNRKVIKGKRGIIVPEYEIPFDKIQNWEFHSMNYLGFLTVNTSLNLYYLNEAGKEKVETLAIGFRKAYIQKVKNEIDQILNS